MEVKPFLAFHSGILAKNLDALDIQTRLVWLEVNLITTAVDQNGSGGSTFQKVHGFPSCFMFEFKVQKVHHSAM